MCVCVCVCVCVCARTCVRACPCNADMLAHNVHAYICINNTSVIAIHKC